jgi:sporulation protein YunB
MKMRKWNHRRWLILFILLIFGGLFLVIDGQIRPMIRATAAYHASIYATNLMNEAVEQQLELVRDAQLVVISQNEQTKITSVTLDMMRINQIKTGITERILQELSSEETEIVEVPLGTLLGSELFSGRGPLIPITLSPMGLANIQMSSGMRQAGINQVLHEVVLHVDVEVSAILPGYSADAKAESDYLISQTVIVGNVPDRYSEASGKAEDNESIRIWEVLDEE